MVGWLWLVPALPLAGFVVLLLAGHALPRRGIALIGAGSVGAAFAVALGVSVSFLSGNPGPEGFVQQLWRWIDVGGFTPGVTLRLDALSLVMMLVVTGVGFLIHLYSTEFMESDASYARFFASMNLFVAAMLTLVLADNLVLLYLGWEGVGLCSYLLIGFWYEDPANGHAARKAFVVTRVGDTAMAIGLFLLYTQLGTMSIPELMVRAAQSWPVGSGMAITAAALLLGGAVGKSAQLPLQTWLPDAMAGPTPVSALIHAATMVTAGVYLIARTHVLFELAPPVMLAVAWVGAATLLMAGFAALSQRDIKRVLAYSTISQIGYMFLALGVGAWSAAIFHLMTHAFFKALLFLGSGVVILALHHEHDIYKMGGLRRQMPVTFWTFLAASAALSGFPLISAGFYSKDLILSQAYSSPQGGFWLWLAGLVGAVLTGIYIFRVVFVAFLGEGEHELGHVPRVRLLLPLVVLGVLSVIGGLVETPDFLGGVHVFSGLLDGALPPMAGHAAPGVEHWLEGAAAAASLLGIGIAWLLFGRRRELVARAAQSPAGASVNRLWASGWAFDWLYDRLLVRPFVWIARVNRDDVVDSIFDLIAWLAQGLNRLLSLTQSGRLRWYAAGLTAGAVLVLAIAVLS